MKTEKGGGCVFSSCIGNDVVCRMGQEDDVIELIDCLSDMRVVAALCDPSRRFV